MINQLKFFIGKIVQNRILQHVLFWLLSYLVLLNILKVSADIQQIDLVYTLFFHIPIVLMVYLNTCILFPLFLEKAKYLLYGILVVGGIAAGAVFYIYLFDSWIDHIFTGYYFIAYYGFWDISLYLAVYVTGTSLIKLARSWFHLQEVQQEKTLAELKALKSQINPHFLFNSLNSIYSLSRKNSPVAPETILKLSGLMRYIIYESDVDLISLESEIEVIKDYIGLQQFRTAEAEKVELKVVGEVEGHKVAPLLFLPFVENSFKHGLKGGSMEAYVSIKFEVSGKVLNFEIGNSIGKSAEPILPKYQGVGIENVRKRLDLVYPGMHKLDIKKDAKRYKVVLQIQLKK